MPFKILPETLWPTADAARQYLQDQRGFRNFREELPIHPGLEYRPTLHLVTRQKYAICVEVSERPYPDSLNNIVIDCIRDAYPLKVFVAFPLPVDGQEVPNYQAQISRARKNGIGVIQVHANGNVEVVLEPLALSLVGVRPIDKPSFPERYRELLANAETTFKSGNPVEACLMVYKQVESLSRLLAERTCDRGYWNAVPAAPYDWEHANWGPQLEMLRTRLQYARCPSVTRPLIVRLEGVVDYRNQTGHHIRSIEDRIARDTQLRTRFESAVDLFKDLVDACRPLRVALP